VLVLALGLPLFLCMPLGSDVLSYDVCARKLLRGGVLYRDVADNNLPGIIWAQAAVRAVLGWRSEMLRLADFGFMALVALLLLRWVPAQGHCAAARIWTATALAAFYLFRPEGCHCQRDGWMLLPAVVALCLRDRQLRTPSTLAPGAAVFRWSVLEGACWGAAVWIKPFVAVPALTCWLVGARSARRGWGLTFLDAGGLLTGGLVVGGLGLAWLAASGAWPSFREMVFGWNGEYAATTYSEITHSRWLFIQAVLYLPWSLIHVAALAVALAAVARAVFYRRAPDTEPSRALLGAFYLGWLAQAVFLQRPHDYVLLPTFFPAFVLVAGAIQTECRPAVAGAVLLPFVLFAATITPGLRPERLGLWLRCWQEGSSPGLRDRLQMCPRAFPGATDWQDLARVVAFLRAEGVGDGELTCLSGGTHPLFLELGVEPATRFHRIHTTVHFFPSHAEEIRAELAASRTRYVVSDLVEPTGLAYAQALEEVPGDPLALPPSFPPGLLGRYPWREELVFRSGRYVIHRVRGPVTKFWDSTFNYLGKLNP
jgi:hypothetical protein